MDSGRQALEVADAIGSRRYQANANHVLGKTHVALKQPEQGLRYLEVAYRLLNDLGEEAEAAAVQDALGRARELDQEEVP